MSFDPDAFRAWRLETAAPWSVRDTMLYALGVGADELAFIYEPQLKALPTMPVVLGLGADTWDMASLGVDFAKVVHGEVEVRLHRPVPVSGHFSCAHRCLALYDKGAAKGAVALMEQEVRDAGGESIATVINTNMLRGDGGFGGTSEGQPKPHPLPDRDPDIAITLATAPNQAALYRLSGDYNPLHIDPAAAARGGFDRPILQGLCTFAVAGRAALRTLAGNDPAAIRRIGVRFSSPFFPGETLRTEIWREGAGRAAFRAIAVERGVTVLTNGFVEYA